MYYLNSNCSKNCKACCAVFKYQFSIDLTIIQNLWVWISSKLLKTASSLNKVFHLEILSLMLRVISLHDLLLLSTSFSITFSADEDFRFHFSLLWSTALSPLQIITTIVLRTTILITSFDMPTSRSRHILFQLFQLPSYQLPS